MVSAYSIRDCDLLSGTGSITLALLDVAVPLEVFFFSAPIFLLLVFLYVHVHMRRAVEDLPRYLSVKYWPLSELPFRPRGAGLVLSLITNAIVWGSWAAASLLLTMKILPLKDPWLGPLHTTFAGLAVGASIWNFQRVRARQKATRHTPLAIGVSLIVFSSLAVTGLVCHGTLNPTWLPTRYTDFKSADIGALNLENRNLWSANFARARLPQATLDASNLTRSTFSVAELEYASFCGAALFESSFRGAKARRARFRCGEEDFRGVVQRGLH